MLALATFACSAPSHRDDPVVVAEVEAILASDDAVRQFADEVANDYETARVERLIRGAPAHTARLSVRAVRVLATDAGRADATGAATRGEARHIGALIGTVRSSLRRVDSGGEWMRIAAGYAAASPGPDYPLATEPDLPGAVAAMHFAVARDAYFDARDPTRVLERRRAGPEVDAIRADYRAFGEPMEAAFVAR